LSGPLSGRDLRLLIVDQGVRLLDGTLQAHFDGTQLRLDHLRFPAVRRVTPKEWRTATWVAENPDAQNGDLDVSGVWDLIDSEGQAEVAFRRYPVLQRSDRYAMISGALQIRATLPQIHVGGKITADAGWFDLDMLNAIPSLDGDVVVLKPGEQNPLEPAAPPLDLGVDLTVDLGPRFYLTGFGLDSGLVGSLDLHMADGKLTALGQLRTRGGAVSAYGQHLQLRHGTITFQGDVANPVLDIQALRTDVAVQAGVQVAGTARRPRIDLMSRPEVSETEKLSWLLLGHGPDQGGADMSLLFSVGSSFLSGGEPFYKRFGLDELSMRSGELGATGSILPVENVVSGLDTGASPIEQRFVMAGKTLTDDLKLSLEQALAQTGTVARLSYRLMRNLQAEVTAGTVNGLALVYRWFSMD
jgi:translocation and assembly module TamB